MTVTGAVLVAAIVLAVGFDHDHPATMQATTDISWSRRSTSASTSASTASRSPSWS
ncbi:hypothetical protein SBADM41S_11971 [Streptomyces badius]